MKVLRKSSLIAVIFLGIWLLTVFSYSMQTVCSCCYPEASPHGCRQNSNTPGLSFEHGKQHEKNHCHQGRNQCHKEDNDCFCMKCSNSSTGEALVYSCLVKQEKKQILAPDQDIFERKSLLTERIAPCQERKLLTKFLSVFLLKTSFLL